MTQPPQTYADVVQEEVERMNAWKNMADAPKVGEIIIWLGETWPDHFDIRAGSYVDGPYAEEMGYQEYAKYGAWMIVHERGEDWYLIDLAAPKGWFPIPTTESTPDV